MAPRKKLPVAFLFSLAAASPALGMTLCPDGSYVGGPSCALAPDGSYVSGGVGPGSIATLSPSNGYVRGSNQGPRLAPDGSYVGGTGYLTLCPDGTYVAGQCHLAPNGRYVGE